MKIYQFTLHNKSQVEIMADTYQEALDKFGISPVLIDHTECFDFSSDWISSIEFNADNNSECDYFVVSTMSQEYYGSPINLKLVKADKFLDSMGNYKMFAVYPVRIHKTILLETGRTQYDKLPDNPNNTLRMFVFHFFKPLDKVESLKITYIKVYAQTTEEALEKALKNLIKLGVDKSRIYKCDCFTFGADWLHPYNLENKSPNEVVNYLTWTYEQIDNKLVITKDKPCQCDAYTIIPPITQTRL